MSYREIGGSLVFQGTVSGTDKTAISLYEPTHAVRVYLENPSSPTIVNNIFTGTTVSAPAIVSGSPDLTVTSGANQTVIRDNNRALIAGSNIVIASGTNTIQISSTASSEGAHALIGVGGITIISGSNITTVSGFHNEFILASGSLQNQIDGKANSTEVVSLINGDLVGEVFILGDDGIEIDINPPTFLTVVGFRSEFIAASGSLQNQISAIVADEIEPAIVGDSFISVVSGSNTIHLVADAIVGGTGITVASGVNTVTISPDTTFLATVSSLVSVSGHLQSQISSIVADEIEPAIIGTDGITVTSGVNTTTIAGFRTEFVNASGSLQTQINNLDSIYATDSNLTSVSGHLQSQISAINIDEIEPAITGSDGITIISGTSTTNVAGFRAEFVAASGTLQSQISSIVVDEIEPAIVSGSPDLTITSGTNQIVVRDNNRAIIPSNSNLTVTSGTNTITIALADALSVSSIIAVSLIATEAVSGTVGRFSQTVSSEMHQATTVSGLRGVFVDSLTISGIPVNIGAADHGTLIGLSDDDHLQYSRVDGTRPFTSTVGGVTPTLDAHLATKGYVDASHKALIGTDGVTITSGTNTVAVAGFRDEFVAASGSLQSQINAVEASDVDTITVTGTSLLGDITLQGLGSVTLLTSGQTVLISGGGAGGASASAETTFSSPTTTFPFTHNLSSDEVTVLFYQNLGGGVERQTFFDTLDVLSTNTVSGSMSIPTTGRMVVIAGGTGDSSNFLLTNGSRPLTSAWAVGNQNITGINALAAVTGTFTTGITVGSSTTFIYPNEIRTGNLTSSGTVTAPVVTGTVGRFSNTVSSQMFQAPTISGTSGVFEESLTVQGFNVPTSAVTTITASGGAYINSVTFLGIDGVYLRSGGASTLTFSGTRANNLYAQKSVDQASVGATETNLTSLTGLSIPGANGQRAYEVGTTVAISDNSAGGPRLATLKLYVGANGSLSDTTPLRTINWNTSNTAGENSFGTIAGYRIVPNANQRIGLSLQIESADTVTVFSGSSLLVRELI